MVAQLKADVSHACGGCEKHDCRGSRCMGGRLISRRSWLVNVNEHDARAVGTGCLAAIRGQAAHLGAGGRGLLASRDSAQLARQQAEHHRVLTAALEGHVRAQNALADEPAPPRDTLGARVVRAAGQLKPRTPKPSNAQRAISRVACVSTPRPRELSANEYPPRRALARGQSHTASRRRGPARGIPARLMRSSAPRRGVARSRSLKKLRASCSV